MQTELLNRRRWTTRTELANAIFDYPEVFHNRRRRHSAPGMLTPTQFELQHSTRDGSHSPSPDSSNTTPPNPWYISLIPRKG
jgi:hypothetical protein